MEYLSDASFLGKLLVFPANVRLDWKVIASYKHPSLFGLIDNDEGKKFYDTDTCGLYYKHMMIVNYASSVVNKLEALLADDARVFIYDCHVFIVQATVMLLIFRAPALYE